MFDFNSDKIKVYFSKYAIFQMEFAMIELEFDVQTFFNADLHFDGSIGIWFGANIGNNKFLFLSYPIVISIDNHIDVVSQINHYAIVGLKLFFNPIELKIIRDIVC